MLSTREVADRLGLKTTSRVRQLILNGQLKATKRGRDWWVEEKDLEEFQALDRPVGRPKTLPDDSDHDSDRNEPPNPIAQS